MHKLLLTLSISMALVSCGNEDNLKVSSFLSDEVSQETMVVMVVGNEGPEPIGMLRICTDTNVEYTEHQTAGSLKVMPGELFVVEQPNWFDERRLCTFTRFTFNQFINVFDKASIIEPTKTGPGIYFMGSVISPEHIKFVQNSMDLYSPQIKDIFKPELKKVLKRYKQLAPMNFDLADSQ